MDDTVLRSLLFDYYGDLLTQRQRECYDLHYNGDLSLQEIAEETGASRQAVWDVIRRAEQTLRQFEEKTGLVARALQRRERVGELKDLAQTLPDSPEKRSILKKLGELDD